MQNPLEITFHNIDHNSKIENLILEKFENVKKISSVITKCHVTIERLSSHHQSANRSCVRLDVKVPHFTDIIISEKCSEDEASLLTTVIKVFKRAKSLLREEVARVRANNRLPKSDDFAIEVESKEDPEESEK